MEEDPGRPYFWKGKIKNWLEFAKMHVNKPQLFWDKVLWIAETSEEWGVSVMIWVFFSASGTGCLESDQEPMKSEDYWGILEWKILPSDRELSFSQRSWLLQQNKDPKHTSERREENSGLLWSGLQWYLILIQSNVDEKGLNLQLRSGTHQTQEKWSSWSEKSRWT